MKPVSVIPTLCTLGNAFCGFLAISKGADAVAALGQGEGPEAVQQFQDLMATGCWLIFLAMVFDALDGRIARMTQQTSDFGACLDSLTDMLTFGAAPALLLKFLVESSRELTPQPFAPKLVLLLTVLYVCCAAMRLAKFTIETEEESEAHDYFAGLPTPAAAGFLCASMLFYLLLSGSEPTGVGAVVVGESAFRRFADPLRVPFLSCLLLASPVLGLLMISRMRYIHLVNRYMRGRRPYTYVAQIVFVLFLLAILEIWALFVAFLLYVALCPILSKWDAARNRSTIVEEEVR